MGGGLEQGDQRVGLVPHPGHHLLGQGAVGKLCVDLKDWQVLCEASLDKVFIKRGRVVKLVAFKTP